jgi:putative tryptophan/tyrosine transport system substrate-binding protein
MTRRLLITALLVALAAPLAAEPERNKPPHVGFLSPNVGPVPAADVLRAFREGLVEFGYVDEQDLTLEYRFAKGTDRLPALAAELIGLESLKVQTCCK